MKYMSHVVKYSIKMTTHADLNILFWHYELFPFQCMSSTKQNNYRTTKAAITTPMIKRTQVPTAPPTVAGRIFAEDVGITL